MITALLAKIQTYAVKALIAIAVIVAIFFGGLYVGDKHVRNLWALDKAQQVKALADAEARAAQVTTKVVTQYVDRVQVVHEKGQTITKEVPVYVTKRADAACPIPVGFVRVHNAAVDQVPLPDAAGPADAEPSGVALSTVASTVSVNYEQYHAVVEQLTALQQWVRDQQAAAEKR